MYYFAIDFPLLALQVKDLLYIYNFLQMKVSS